MTGCKMFFPSEGFVALSSLSKIFINSRRPWLPNLISHLFHPGFFSSWPLPFYTRGVLVEIYKYNKFIFHEFYMKKQPMFLWCHLKDLSTYSLVYIILIMLVNLEYIIFSTGDSSNDLIWTEILLALLPLLCINFITLYFSWKLFNCAKAYLQKHKAEREMINCLW